jgi:hypothetical protein
LLPLAGNLRNREVSWRSAGHVMETLACPDGVAKNNLSSKQMSFEWDANQSPHKS